MRPDRPARIAALVSDFLSRGASLPVDASDLPARIDAALDPSRSLDERIAAIRWLVRLGDDEAVDVLERLLRRDGAPAVRAAVARGLGACDHPRAVEILTALVDDGDPDVVLGALDGLALHGGPETAELLGALLADPTRAEDVRARAARALGVGGDAGGEVLLDLADVDGLVSPALLEGLAQLPFEETEARFRDLLGDPRVGVDAKVAALEALGEGTPAAGVFLAEIAATADSAELRSAAVDALTLFDEPGDAVDALATLVPGEPDAGVRADLYNTLAFHAERANSAPNADALVASTLAERAALPRVEGYRMVASMLHDRPAPELADTFDAAMVPWLQQSAESASSPYTRRLSVDALGLAGTPGAREALLDLTHSPDRGVSQSAEGVLRISRKTGSPGVP